MAEFISTRRGVVAAMAVAPLAAALPAMAVASPAAEWDRVMRQYLAAKHAYNVYDWQHIASRIDRSLPIGPERSAAVLAVPNHLYEESQRLCTVMLDCEDRLMSMPAPHGEALAWKLEVLFDANEDGFTPSWNAKVVQPVIADARRMSA